MLARLPSSLLPLLLASLVALPRAAAQEVIVSDFSGYPSNIRQCLVKADRCKGFTKDKEVSECLCPDTDGFITKVARCVYMTSESDLESVYGLLKQNCDWHETPLEIDRDEFREIGEEAKESDGLGASSADKPDDTGSSDEGSTEKPAEEEKNSGGLSQGATIGIAVGSTAVAVALIAAVLFFLMRRRNKNDPNRHSLAPLTGRDSGYQSVPFGEYKPTTEGYPTATNTPQTHYGPNSPPAWGPESFVAAGGNISPPPTTGGRLSPHSQQWSDPSRPTSWNPHASWGSPVQAYQPVATGDVAGLPPPPAQLAPLNTLYELPSTPRAAAPPGPAEMPASPHNPHP